MRDTASNPHKSKAPPEGGPHDLLSPCRKSKGAKVTSPEEATAVAEDPELIISTGPAGIEILPEGFLPKLEKCMVAADVNAFPPAG